MEQKDKELSPEIKQIGARIKELRITKGYSNAEKFAYDHNFSRSQYARYERGQDDFRISTLIRICKAFGVSLEEFFGGVK